MWFLIIIIVLLILLIFTSLLNTLLYFSIKLVTKNSYTEQELNLPSFCCILLWITSYAVILTVISKITKMNLIDTIVSTVFNTHNMYQYFSKLILPIIFILIVTVLAQSFILLMINIDYNKIFSKIKYSFKKNIKKEEIINTDTSTMLITEEKYKLNFVNSFSISLFIFSLLFFIGIILFCIGALIADKFI